MQRFKSILLVFGESDLAGPAVQRALKLARINRARITVVDVLQFSPLERKLVRFGEKTKNLHRQMIEGRQRELEELFFEQSQEINITIEVIGGKPFVEIIRLAERRGCDLVIKAAEHRKLFSSMLFGSTDLQLLRKCSCPVWIVKSDDLSESQKIMAAVGLESFDKEEGLNELNQQIIEIASSLAYREGSALNVVNAFIVFDGESLAKKISRQYQEDVDEWVEEQRHSIIASQSDFQKLVEKHLQKNRISDIDCTFHFLEGEPEQVIVDFAEKENIDLIVMGTVARGDVAGFLVGNTSEAVLSQINSSVLAVKPPGFVSPVTVEDQ